MSTDARRQAVNTRIAARLAAIGINVTAGQVAADPPSYLRMLYTRETSRRREGLVAVELVIPTSTPDGTPVLIIGTRRTDGLVRIDTEVMLADGWAPGGPEMTCCTGGEVLRSINWMLDLVASGWDEGVWQLP